MLYIFQIFIKEISITITLCTLEKIKIHVIPDNRFT
jgi:hypothetical protein